MSSIPVAELWSEVLHCVGSNETSGFRCQNYDRSNKPRANQNATCPDSSQRGRSLSWFATLPAACPHSRCKRCNICPAHRATRNGPWVTVPSPAPSESWNSRVATYSDKFKWISNKRYSQAIHKALFFISHRRQAFNSYSASIILHQSVSGSNGSCSKMNRRQSSRKRQTGDGEGIRGKDEPEIDIDIWTFVPDDARVVQQASLEALLGISWRHGQSATKTTPKATWRRTRTRYCP